MTEDLDAFEEWKRSLVLRCDWWAIQVLLDPNDSDDGHWYSSFLFPQHSFVRSHKKKTGRILENQHWETGQKSLKNRKKSNLLNYWFYNFVIICLVQIKVSKSEKISIQFPSTLTQFSMFWFCNLSLQVQRLAIGCESNRIKTGNLSGN